MIYPPILERKYQLYSPFVQEVSERVKDTLRNYCDRQGYAFTSRIKTIESLAEKIETGRFRSWSALNDLFACTVIIPTLLHEKEVIEFCKKTFEITRTVKRGQHRKAPEVFRFDSTRIYARLKRIDDLERDNLLSIYDLIFEVQIKSAFEHAWSVSTHDLVYKNAEIDWRRSRLAAQIKATVEQLDMLILAFQQTSEFIQSNDYPEIKIKCNLANQINSLLADNQIPDVLKPKDISRFCDNLYRVIANATEEKNINNIIKGLIAKIQATPTDEIPLSISLFQYCVILLIDESLIEIDPNKKYFWHITSEVTDLYRSLAQIESVFQYEENS